MNNIDITIQTLVIWLKQNNIGGNDEKRMNIAEDMFWPVYKNKLDVNDINTIRNHIEDNPYNFKEGSLWEDLSNYFQKFENIQKKKYVEFFKHIFDRRPFGLNTSPNANCGKGELMYRLLRPKSMQPNKGDIIDEGKKIDIKGSEIRLRHHHMRGSDYRHMTDNLFELTQIQPNIIDRGKLKGELAYEIEKRSHNAHYISEFKKIPLPEKICLITRYFNELDIDGDTKKFAEKVFQTGDFNRELLVKIIVYDFVKNLDCEWIIFGNGTNVKVLRTKEDLDKFEIKSDYFRIAQEYVIGWYIK